MIQTVIDLNEVFDMNYAKKIPKQQYKRVDNCILFGVKCNEGFRVNRIFSTNPADYLDPVYQSGNIIP